MTKVERFMKSEDGPTAVEYAVMLALIVIVCIASISSIGTEVNSTFETIQGELVNANGLATGVGGN
jgi:pilus assembly protein Flp/PilA